MKLSKTLTVILFISLLALTSCYDPNYSEIGEPFSKVDGIKGTWKITSVIQVDEVALSKGMTFTQLDISQFFDFTNYQITFAVDEMNNPTTFEILNPDNVPNFIPVSGLWFFDNIETPSSVNLVKLNTELLPVDTSQLILIAPPRDLNPLRSKYVRYSKDADGNRVVLLSYKYTFERVNQ